MTDTTDSINTLNWPRFKAMIDEAQTILLVSHIRPDGDAIGSQIAMAKALQDYGKQVILVNGHHVSPNIRFIDPDFMIKKWADLTDQEKGELNNVDLLISLDTRSWAQLGDMAALFRSCPAKKMVLDHHFKGDDIGAEYFINSSADSTGSLVFQAIETLGLPLRYEYAFPIYVAIATDTGWFRFSSVTAETYRTVAKLVDVGVRPDEVYRLAYEQESLGRLKLIGIALAHVEPFLEGKGMFTFLTQKDFDEAGALPSDSEDIVNQTLMVAGTEIAVIMVEQKTGGFKLSFRSRCALDCSELAACFGGGGHKKAAGAGIALPFEEARAKILQKTEQLYRQCR